MLNIQKQKGKRRGQKATKNLDYFHRILRKIAQRFKTSGMEVAPSSGGSGGRGGGSGGGSRRKKGAGQNKDESGGGGDKKGGDEKKGGGKGQPKKGKGKGNPDRDRSGGQKPVPDHVRCVYCNGKNYVSNCPRIPKEKKEWTFAQHLAAKKAQETRSPGDQKTSATGESRGAGPQRENGHPRGGYSTRNPKKSKQAVTGDKPMEADEAETPATPGSKKSVTVDNEGGGSASGLTQADGPVLVGGVRT